MNFIMVTGGPSFPVGDFADNDLSNTDTGLAKTGFAINLKYGYQINPAFGLTLNGMYARYGFHEASITDNSSLSVDSWQYYGIMAGPMVTTKLANRTHADFSLLSGATFARFPKFVYNGTEVVKQDWSTTIPIKLAADVRVGFSNAAFFTVGTDCLYMKPEFTATGGYEGQTLRSSGKQKISTFGINAGIGLNF